MFTKEQKTLSFQIGFLYLVLLLLFLIILFSPIFPNLYNSWILNNDNSHGILVPFISLFLIWKNRHNINFNKAQTSHFGLGVLLVSLMIYVIGYGGRIEILPRLAFVTAIIGLVLYNYGKKIFLSMAFPLIFLYFMIPFPVSIEGLISFNLQLWMTQISSTILSAISISVLREGNILHFADYSFEVAEACSGIRSLTAYIMLGCLFGYMMHGSYLKRLIMVLVALPLAFLVNITRVVGTGLLANYFGPVVARGFLHEFSGVVVFLLGFSLLFILFLFLDKKKVHQLNNLS